MTHIDLGITGAKRSSWRKANPRELLKSIVERFLHDDHEALFQRFRKEVAKASDEMHETIERYYFDNNIRSLTDKKANDPKKKQEQKEAAENFRKAAEEAIKNKIHEEAERILLDAIMPNGKPLRDCTGMECRKMGGWLSGIGERLKPDQIVSDKFSEDQIRSHWNRKVKP